jgi:hypothetical protein
MIKIIALFILFGLVCCKPEKIKKEKIPTKAKTSMLKFDPKINFKLFEVNVQNINKNEKLDFSSNKEANHFRTRLTEAFKSEVINFAGHYTFVYWGCGSNSKAGMVIDRLNGKIYDAPTTSLGYDFKANSTILIINPPDKMGYYLDCFYCKPEIYYFNNKTNIFSQIK